jgi:phage terminase large subunit
MPTSAENRRIWERFRRWKEHPAQMVREEFQVEPDAWQEEILEAFPHHNRLLMKACKGPGKTAVEAWLGLNFLGTRPHCRIGATSITGDNLAQNLWPEFAYWMNKSPFFRETYTWTKTQIVHKQHPATWWIQARSWPKKANAEEQADALAGLHADYAMWLLDEIGGYPQAVMTTAEAVLASGIETKVVCGGNPTHTTGPLYRACTIDKGLWFIVTITGDPDDPKRSPRISLEHAKQQIASYGRDNPWVMVNILGLFPPSSINALIGVEEVQAAMERKLHVTTFNFMQKRLGIDVARFGDDRTVIFPRQGLMSWRPVVMRHERGSSVSHDIAARIMHAKLRWGSEAEWIDDTVGWAHGTIDALRVRGAAIIPVNYAGKALDPRYKNRRAEMWLQGTDFIRNGAVLPNVPELVAELSEPTFTYVGGQFVVEPKDMVKARLGRSPDLADAYLLTHADVDMPALLPGLPPQPNTTRHNVDPFGLGREARDAFDQQPAGRAATEDDPWR